MCQRTSLSDKQCSYVSVLISALSSSMSLVPFGRIFNIFQRSFFFFFYQDRLRQQLLYLFTLFLWCLFPCILKNSLCSNTSPNEFGPGLFEFFPFLGLGQDFVSVNVVLTTQYEIHTGTRHLYINLSLTVNHRVSIYCNISERKSEGCSKTLTTASSNMDHVSAAIYGESGYTVDKCFSNKKHL